MKNRLERLPAFRHVSEAAGYLRRKLSRVKYARAADRFSRHFPTETGDGSGTERTSANPLLAYYEQHVVGAGLHKWIHYLDAYHRHFERFIDREVSLLEIGVHSGGSLEMWRAYLGEKSHIYGVDIQPACAAYQNDHTKVFIGDQSDRSFWRTFKSDVPSLDIVIDDGGHTPRQQRTSLEELLPHLKPGGVYVCEDIHERSNPFLAFACRLVDELNHFDPVSDPEFHSRVSPFQRSVHSMHFYPYLMIIEKQMAAVDRLAAPTRGTKWQPFW